MITIVGVLVMLLWCAPGFAQTVPVVALEGPIGPVAAEYASDALLQAALDGQQLVVVQVDTPGGLDASMRKIVRAIGNAPLAVVVWVGPAGARAASAGLFIVAAGDVAVMAPGTNLGAAHPVGLGGSGGDDTSAKKAEEDAAAYIRSLAQRKGRDPAWFESAVVESKSLSAEEALQGGVIDLLAVDLAEVLAQVDGRVVRKGKTEITIAAGGGLPVTVPMSTRQQVLAVLANPNVAYLLLLLGFYGLFFELSNPGAIFPGVLGGTCLILAFVGLQTLPFNYAGVLLMLLGLLLLLLEVKITSFGLLTVGGALSLLLGSLMLFKTAGVYQRLSYGVVIPAVAATVAFFAFAVGKGLLAQRRAPVSGREGLVGKVGRVTAVVGPEQRGRVFVHGESWRAVGTGTFQVGEAVQVLAVKGMEVEVGPAVAERSE